MDSGRKALLEKAREFGILACSSSWDDILNRSVTYRTLALYLGIQSEWWEEFWRSFSFASANPSKTEKLRCFHLSCKACDVSFFMSFLSLWFGNGTRISDIPKAEFLKTYNLVMREERDGRSKKRI